MDTSNNGVWGGNGIFAIVIFLIVAGMFGGFNGGWGNNSSTTGTITNDFLYTNLARQVGDNGTAINTTDRDVLNSKFDLNAAIMQNRYDNSLQTNTLQNQASVNALQAQNNMDSCCCSIKTAIHEEGEATRALITQNRISDLEKELVNANTIISNQVQSQNILASLGNYYPKSGVNPYYVYGSTYGTTIA